MTILAVEWVVVAGLGLIVGSFINALSFRWGTGRPIAYARSACMRCGHTLGLLDLVPVVSYLALRGKCRYCSSSISAQYPLVELAGGMLAVGVYYTEGALLSFLFWFVVWMILLFVAVYDFRHTIIPWSCSVLLGVLGLGYVLLQGPTLWSLLAGPVLAFPLLFMHFVSRGRWMGLGDGLLELSLGWLIGGALSFVAAFTALLYAFWGGALIGLVMIALPRLSSMKLWRKERRRLTIKSEIPFAPFLIGGAAVMYFFNVDLFSHIGYSW